MENKNYSYDFMCSTCRLNEEGLNALHTIISKDFESTESSLEIIAQPVEKYLKKNPDKKELKFGSMSEFINNEDIREHSERYDFTILYTNPGISIRISLPRNKKMFSQYKTIEISGSNETSCIGKFIMLKNFLSARSSMLSKIIHRGSNPLGFMFLLYSELALLGCWFSGIVTKVYYLSALSAFSILGAVMLICMIVLWFLPKTTIILGKPEKWYSNPAFIGWAIGLLTVAATIVAALVPFWLAQ